MARFTKQETQAIARAVFNFEQHFAPTIKARKVGQKAGFVKAMKAGVFAARKEARKALSAELQAVGMPISGKHWEAAKNLAGLK